MCGFYMFMYVCKREDVCVCVSMCGSRCINVYT